MALSNAVLAFGHDLTGVAVLRTEPECLVPLGIGVLRRDSRSPAAERFLAFAREHLPEVEEE